MYIEREKYIERPLLHLLPNSHRSTRRPAHSPAVGNRLAMALAIEYRPVVVGGHLKIPLPLKYFQTVEGSTFFKVCKGDPCTTRLLVEDVNHHCTRPLSMTNIIEELVCKRNCIYNSLAFAKAETEETEDLGLDAPAKTKAKDLSELPAVVTLQAPAVESIPGQEVKVLMAKTGRPLWVELNTDNLQYLVGVIGCQIKSGTIKNAHIRSVLDDDARISSDTKGVSYSYKRKSVRATGVANGKITTKYFKVMSDEQLQPMLDEAAAWLMENSSGASSSAIVPVEDQSSIDPESDIAPLQDQPGMADHSE